ncbi:alpha/beta hydrolase [Saccharopolyspora shandongensis]|uniref:alpha/beta fold hydrolase n=1 Tax=Saccharopolyspora shandongensis TaxID=418495 RepID=UPI0034230F35
MTEIAHRFVRAGDTRMHVAEAGSGPLVVLLHGFPETWYSWRHQLRALAAAGYHAVAPDQRGCGRTDQPNAVEDYTILHTVGDVIHLIDVLGAESAVLAGHDWGGVVAWHAALMRPDVVRGVVSLSTPFQPHADGPHLAGLRAGAGADTGIIAHDSTRTDFSAPIPTASLRANTGADRACSSTPGTPCPRSRDRFVESIFSAGRVVS